MSRKSDLLKRPLNVAPIFSDRRAKLDRRRPTRSRAVIGGWRGDRRRGRRAGRRGDWRSAVALLLGAAAVARRPVTRAPSCCPGCCLAPCCSAPCCSARPVARRAGSRRLGPSRQNQEPQSRPENLLKGPAETRNSAPDRHLAFDPTNCQRFRSLPPFIV